MLRTDIKCKEQYALQSAVLASLFFLPVIPIQRFYVATACVHAAPSPLAVFSRVIKKPSAIRTFFDPP